ncbi:hypothetical protein [Rhodococcus pyridinivorans]|uniref:hypothetical protein n=1 Tax=Rhodococcus pyridinivorans TaxID=103816 RepID=UPI0026870684
MTDKDAGAGSLLIPHPTPADPATVFFALTEILYGGSDATEVYVAICVAATSLVPGYDHASAASRNVCPVDDLP